MLNTNYGFEISVAQNQPHTNFKSFHHNHQHYNHQRVGNVCVSEGKKYSFFGKFDVFEIRLFTVLPTNGSTMDSLRLFNQN